MDSHHAGWFSDSFINIANGIQSIDEDIPESSYLHSIYPVPGVPQDDLVAVRGDVVVSGGVNLPIYKSNISRLNLEYIFVLRLT